MPEVVSTYTVTGTGGLSPAIPGFHAAPFWWIDYTGGEPGTTLHDYGFHLTPGAPSWLQDNAPYHLGSLLLSTPFTLNQNATLTVDLTVLTGMTQVSTPGQIDVGFALLLEASAVSAILTNSRGDGGRAIVTVAHPPQWDLIGPGVGVTTVITALSASPLSQITLGAATYGPSTQAGECSFPCGIDVTSTYVPGAGTYQLLFGVYMVAGGIHQARPSALIVRSVRVPGGASRLKKKRPIRRGGR